MTEPSTEQDFDRLADSILASTLGTNGGDANPPKPFAATTDWVSPVEKNRRRRAVILPSQNTLDEFEQRIGSTMRWPEPPADVSHAAEAARSKIALARTAIVEAGSAANRHYAETPERAQVARAAVTDAERAVDALEQAATDSFPDWINGICAKVPETHTAALEALREAQTAYRAHVRLTSAAQAMLEEFDAPLAYERYAPGGAKARQQINAPLQGIEQGLALLNGTPFESGLYLTDGAEGRPSAEALAQIRNDSYSRVGVDFRHKFDRLFQALGEPLPQGPTQVIANAPRRGPAVSSDDVADIARLVGVNGGPDVIVTSIGWEDDPSNDDGDLG